MELAHQLSRPNSPYPKSQVARTLWLAQASLYLHSKQAIKDERIAVSIEQWHELDDTLGHRKLAVLLGMGKNWVKRVIQEYGLAAQAQKIRLADTAYPGAGV